MSKINMTKFNKRKCNCGADGTIWVKNRWYCKKQTEFGFFNITGYCPKEKKKK